MLWNPEFRNPILPNPLGPTTPESLGSVPGNDQLNFVVKNLRFSCQKYNFDFVLVKLKSTTLIFLIIVRNSGLWRETCVTQELKLKTDLRQTPVTRRKTKQQNGNGILIKCSFKSALVTNKIFKISRNRKLQNSRLFYLWCCFLWSCLSLGFLFKMKTELRQTSVTNVTRRAKQRRLNDI